MMAYPERDVHNLYNFWKHFFNGQGIEIIKIDPNSHDKIAANSQGITHFIGRSLKEFGAKRSTIDTQGYRNLLDLVDQTCNDTWELYEDLQTYNPYTKLMINQINEAIKEQTNKLSEGINE
jgi:prephenate dehydrogenase